MAGLTVGFVGLGAMGVGIAHNLHKHLQQSGSRLLVHNRTRSKPEVDRLLTEGAVWADSPADLATKCDVVFSMLIADAALESVFKSYISGKPKQGSIYIDCSTVYPDLAQKLEAQAAELGIAYLACPVFGRPDATLAGKVLVVASGDPAAKQRVRPLLDVIGRGVLDVGPSARLGNTMKLVGNYYIMSMLELIAEGMTLAEKNGIDRQHVVHFLKESFQGPITGGYAERAAADAFQMDPGAPGFNVQGGLKDATHVQNLGRESGVPMPVVDIVVDHLTELNQRGGGDLEWGSSALLIRERAGIEDKQKRLNPKPSDK